MAMEAAGRKLAITLAIIAIVLSLTMANMRLAHSESIAGGNIDLYTQKEPYSGIGPNATSDAFGPGEEVQIYAQVTYNVYPVRGLLVAFQVSGPRNPVENISLYRTASTNELGQATTSFRVSHLNETTFGEWTAFGSARIGDSNYADTVSFKVGWIVEIISLKTLDENHAEQEEFTRGSYVGIELSVQNIAIMEKTAALTVTIYDCLGTSVNATELSGLIVPPNGTLVYAYFFLYVPRTAHLGNATAYACAFTASPTSNGAPYCPEVSKSFLISSIKCFLEVRTEPAHVATILGEGWYEENANVSLTAPRTVLVSESVRYEFSYWDVNGLSRDFGVNLITIQMNGPQTATAHYTQIMTYTLTIATTAGGTTDPPPGAYSYASNSTVHARAIANTNYVFDHWELDGSVVGSSNPYLVTMDANHILKAAFKPGPSGWFAPEWFYWLSISLLLILFAILLLALWYRRRKKSQDEFYSGWTAWYYECDLRGKNQRVHAQK
jgi:hypothetical protein